ncbi:hypothetical protein C0Q70_08261 [Pomacea canaliculata]|uniref:Uncharacterized protein n=1 Tax=Pomacea canaliculata TaxID=400727 RepID=A0A2T7PHC1_POMCA|nr:hypothetical protein C0Q70_08261 [Pomacea canaliculata]
MTVLNRLSFHLLPPSSGHLSKPIRSPSFLECSVVCLGYTEKQTTGSGTVTASETTRPRDTNVERVSGYVKCWGKVEPRGKEDGA